MYRPSPSLRDRAGPLAAVLLIHVGIGYGLLHLSGADVELARQADLAIFDVLVVPPPPPPPPPPPAAVEPEKTKAKRKAKRDEGAASPRNIESQATPVVAPKPRIIVPAPSPVVAAVTPAIGAGPTQGASPVAGPGTGAGGSGTGTGSGGSGTGAGGGGEGGGGNGLGEARARLVTPGLSPRDYPGSIYRRWPRGGAVFIIIRVGPDGIPLSCRIARSIGDEAIDSETCRLALAHFRFEPGRDERGRPVADFVGYRQEEYGRERR